MKYQTSITKIENEKEYIRGKELTELIKNKTFTETIFFILRGKEPTQEEKTMLDAMFVAAIDHGAGTASAQTARITASAKNSMHTSLAAGILAMGERHGSAIQGAAEFFLENKNCADIKKLVEEVREKKLRIAGFGHPFLSHDYRSDTLFEIAKHNNLYAECCAFAEAFHKELNTQSSKKLALNIDGAMAAILADMDFDPTMLKGIFIIARMPGLVAHVYEEIVDDRGIRRLDESDIEYIES